jgi:N-carbamoyl-L-amino-acid hydrolase
MAVDTDSERFKKSFETYSAIGATDNEGLNRLTLTDADKEVRDTFRADLEAMGLDVRVDRIGNMFARREGTDPDAAPVLIGSHLDSQPFGGRYDGQLGVLCALETLRAFEDAGIETDRPVEIVNWTNEEGSRFEHAMLGSAVWAGVTDLSEALELTDSEGKTVREELERIGYDGDEPCKAGDIHSYLELHIEQGPYLEQRDLSVGIVEGTYGMAWLEATITGEADHAGPTPMHRRSDAMGAAADAISGIHGLPNRLSPDAVATVGRMDVSPGSINAIPSEVTYTVDVRSYDDGVVDEAVSKVKSEIEAACGRWGTEFELEELWRISHTEFSKTVRNAALAGVETAGVSYQEMIGGAGHDANYVNRVTDSGMLFVPSVDGETHTEAEYTEWEDAVAGAKTYAATVEELATE